ncbi:MAG: nitroreductase family protein [Erysipelotrichaceae bacterium]|nr:nitroreductase family protein [Erysipelotrichaceae bacterium]
MNEIFHRVSIRRFTGQEVEAEKVELLLRAAMAAPSAANQQPWEFVVVTNKAVLEQLSKTTPYASCLANAPLGIVILIRKECRIPEYAEIDCSIACENIWLEADSLGLGCVWLGVAPVKERVAAVDKVLRTPPVFEAFALLAVGYPAEERVQQDRFDPKRIHYLR